MHNVTVLDDDDNDKDFIKAYTSEDFGIASAKPQEEYDDPFNLKWSEIRKNEGLSPNFRRHASRLEKAFTGVDDAKSKKLDPLDLTGYSLFQIVQPP